MITQELCSSYNNSLCRSKAIFISLFIWLSGLWGWLGTGAAALWGRGHVHPGEDMASGGPYSFPPVPMRWLPARWKEILYCGAWWKNDSRGHKMGASDLKYRNIKTSISKKSIRISGPGLWKKPTLNSVLTPLHPGDLSRRPPAKFSAQMSLWLCVDLMTRATPREQSLRMCALMQTSV